MLKNRLIMCLLAIANMFGARHQAPGKSDRFLIISSTGIGDTLWGTPAIRALRSACPDCYIAVLTNALGAEMLKGNPAPNELFIFRRGAGSILRLPILISLLRKRKFGKVYIFHASDRIIWPIAFLSGAPEIVGFKGQSKEMDFVLTKMVEADPALHGIENRFRMIKESGIQEKDETLELFLTEKDREEAWLFLRQNGIGDQEMLIGLHPGAQKPFKCWPDRNFIEAGSMLKNEFGCRIVVTGDAGERTLAEKVTAGISGAISSAGILSLRGTAALIERMRLFITNDTGPMHIAFAVKTPVIAMFCPTDPRLCGPYRAAGTVVIAREISCEPCIGKKCTNPICLAGISPIEVVRAAEELLGKKAKA